MIVRVIAGLVAIAFFAAVRGLRRRSRQKKAIPPAMTVRNGYTGLENPLYRVVIERGGAADGATFRWSRDDERDTASQTLPVQAGTWISLGNGIDVRFEGDAFEPGDFWTFPARSAADTVTKKARRRGAPSARGRAKRRR
jgi:uncharacterized protein DUF6519